MEAKELRLTNFIFDDNGDTTKVFVLSNYGCPEINDDQVSNRYKPIPLTEEWLRKFGFKNWGDKYTFGLKGINIHKRQRGFILRKSVPIIKYVHQLQNLYFALTGEELILKES